MRRAVYPGSFDPMTSGHVNIIERGLEQCDHLIVAVARNISKTAMFTIEERIEMIQEHFAHEPRLTVVSFEGLLVDFAESQGCQAVLRGLRAIADFEYEYQMANMNRKLNSNIETLFLMADPNNFYVSSRLVKEVAILGGDLHGVVPDAVRARLTERVRSRHSPQGG